jgi:hypothetical protein
VGLAYALSPKTVLRAAYGISYGPAWQKWLGSNGQLTSADGWAVTRTSSTLDNGVTPAFNWNNGFPIPFPTLPDINPTLDNGGIVEYVDRDSRPPMTQNISAEVGQELPGQISVRVAYVGTMAHRLPARDPYDWNSLPLTAFSMGSLLTADINSPAARAAGIPIPYAGFTGSVAQALKPYPQYLSVQPWGVQIGNSTYNALQVNAQKRFGQGLTFLAAYTLSKQLTNVDFPGYNGAGSTTVRSIYLLKQDGKRLLSKDEPQIFNISWVYELPFGSGKRFANGAKGPLNAVIGGWTFSAIQNYFSGRPISVTTNATNPVAGEWPILIPGVPIKQTGCGKYAAGDPSRNRFLNINAFASPDAFGNANPQYPNLPFGNISQLENVRTCGYLNENVQLDKTTKIHERMAFQFGSIFSNLFNRHPWVGDSFQANITNPSTFGTYTSAYPGRTVQFFLKLIF